MSLPNELMPVGLLGTGVSGYFIKRSLRFNSADSANLSRTPASAGNRKTFTFAAWIKSAVTAGGDGRIFTTATPIFNLRLSSNKIWLQDSGTSYRLTTQLFRDPSAWFHIVLAIDTTQATASNRIKLHVNGTEITAFDTNVNPTQNADFGANNTVLHYIGGLSTYFDGYLADIHFIDGQALDPTSFGEFDTNGIWQPKAYTGTYGTNGFHLDFADNSAATATTLGKDTSGNGNNWTPNNLSVTAGAGNDSLVDSPTNYGTDTGVGGEVRGNYATLNVLNKPSTTTLSNGNLDAVVTDYASPEGTMGVSSGKWYWEVTATANNASGRFATGIKLVNNGDQYDPGYASSAYAYYSDGNKRNNATYAAYGATYTINDVIGVLLDLDAKTISFTKNGASQGTAFSSLPAGTYVLQIGNNLSSSSTTFIANFGQRPFAYAAPSGFKALCSTNLPVPTILKGSSYFDTVLWTGTGSALTPTSSLGFSPDLVWIKGRSGATDHAIYDTVRGATLDLVSNSTAAETTQATGLTAFNSDGFALGALAKLNTSSATYAAWCWDAGTSNVTNTAGSITSTVRANASAGFSVVSYTGAASSTVGHGLGVAPALIILKKRDDTSDWPIYHSSLGVSSVPLLNSTGTPLSLSNYWGSSITSTTFGTASNSAYVNASGSLVAYCFAPVAGYSSFGSYTGNGSSTDGPFVYTGHRPRWILLKRTDTTSNWTIIDTSREGYNVDNDPLFPNLADAETTTDLADILSNGFKLRSTDASVNANTGTYIYASISENPFSISRAR